MAGNVFHENTQILVALKLTSYRLLFNHLSEQLILLGKDLRKEKEKYIQEKKAHPSLKPTQHTNIVLKHFNILYTLCHEMKDSIFSNSMKLL